MVTRPKFVTPEGVSLNPRSKWMMENLRLMSPPDSTNIEELARFQQKQLQEKEQKLLQLYDQQQQRAHQVAQRGSAGSSGSNGSGGSGIIRAAGNVRQLFEERRKQSNVRGIDKSYPLDPLNGRSKKKPIANQAVNGRRNNAQPTKRGAIKANGAVAANNNRATSMSRESYASSRSSNSYKDPSNQRDSYTRESYASSRADYDEQNESSRQRLNGHARHYEINIDEVIDNEAMERNRLLAKFHQIDIDRRRHFDIDSEDVPGDEEYFGSRRSSLDQPRAASPFRSSNNTRKSNALTAATVAPVAAAAAAAAAASATKKPSIPTGARQSTVMKTTKSASLKIRKKVPLSSRASKGRPRSTSLSKINPGKEATKKRDDAMSKSVGCLDRDADWSALKSTSLIFEMIRKASKLGQIGDADRMGKVKKMVIKIESSVPSALGAEGRGNSASDGKSSTEARTEQNQRELQVQLQQQQQQPSTSSPITNSDSCKSDAREDIEVSACTSSQEILLKNIESEDQGDGLMRQVDLGLLASRGKRESSVEHPSEYQEITITDQAIVKRLETPQKRVRRASFELKRLMFEQIQARSSFERHDSVESALRHFDSIGAEPVSCSEPDNAEGGGRSTLRLCGGRDAARRASETLRGFERHTSAWSTRTLRNSAACRHAKAPVATPRRAVSRRRLAAAGVGDASTKSPGKKLLLEARDSIELARIPMLTRLPACRRKILLVANSRPAAGNDDGGESSPVKSQSFIRSRELGRVARLRRIFTREQTAKNHDFSPSTTRHSTTDSTKTIKNVTPYPSSKSPDNLAERSRASGGLRFPSQLDGSNGEPENGFPSAARKSGAGVAAVDGAADEKPRGYAGAEAAASRPTASASSNSSVGTNRSQGSTASTRPSAKSKAPPTPAARSSPSSRGSAESHDDYLSTCKICDRRFAADRIELHEQICAKTSQKKRKQFDAVTHRVKGTELESFVQKPGKMRGKASAPKPAAVEPTKSNWRRKHEDFIQAIRSAKQMQVHLASGGKLSDLPPPPPSDTSDYVQCPHCSRRFNQGAAERHIPKCETMQHNKPNPRAPPKPLRR